MHTLTSIDNLLERRCEAAKQSMENDGYEMVVFTEATKIPRHERAAFLDKACEKDRNLRHKVEALLSAHDRMGDFLEEPPTGGPTNESN